jgi:DNA mismatch endonuclease (patch repair protein)
MGRIRGKNTTPELRLACELSAFGVPCEQHCADLPGRPDFVFRDAKWQAKIDATRLRDRRNFAALRRKDWKVIRIWEHQIERDAAACAMRICAIVSQRVN